ncbi:MAG: type II toxin-antitoxin system prevent-host-death family antitoxin [Chloroflexota bacterium]
MTVTNAKARLLGLIDQVEQGEEVELTRHGRVVARLVPAKSPRGLRGLMVGQAVSVATDEELFGTGEEWDVVR